jgi:hypothetical protein
MGSSSSTVPVDASQLIALGPVRDAKLLERCRARRLRSSAGSSPLDARHPGRSAPHSDLPAAPPSGCTGRMGRGAHVPGCPCTGRGGWQLSRSLGLDQRRPGDHPCRRLLRSSRGGRPPRSARRLAAPASHRLVAASLPQSRSRTPKLGRRVKQPVTVVPPGAGCEDDGRVNA